MQNIRPVQKVARTKTKKNRNKELTDWQLKMWQLSKST